MSDSKLRLQLTDELITIDSMDKTLMSLFNFEFTPGCLCLGDGSDWVLDKETSKDGINMLIENIPDFIKRLTMVRDLAIRIQKNNT